MIWLQLAWNGIATSVTSLFQRLARLGRWTAGQGVHTDLARASKSVLEVAPIALGTGVHKVQDSKALRYGLMFAAMALGTIILISHVRATQVVIVVVWWLFVAIGTHPGVAAARTGVNVLGGLNDE